LPAITGFLSSPEESAASFVSSLNDAGREKTRSHGMGNQSSENQVDEN
jgi:hypothetical protein